MKDGGGGGRSATAEPHHVNKGGADGWTDRWVKVETAKDGSTPDQ